VIGNVVNMICGRCDLRIKTLPNAVTYNVYISHFKNLNATYS